jgi:hypothetical protein
MELSVNHPIYMHFFPKSILSILNCGKAGSHKIWEIKIKI